MIDWLFKKLNINFTNTPYEWVVSFLALGVFPILAMLLAYFLPEDILDRSSVLKVLSDFLVEFSPRYQLVWQHNNAPQVSLAGSVILWCLFPIQVFFTWKGVLNKKIKKNELSVYMKGFLGVFLLFIFLVFMTFFISDMPAVDTSKIFNELFIKTFKDSFYMLIYSAFVGFGFSIVFVSFWVLVISLLSDIKSNNFKY